MPKDLFTLQKTATLYSELLIGAKINKIIEPTADEVVLTLYNKRAFNIVISTKAKYARVSLTTQSYKAPLNAPNFSMLLRKYLLGGTITGYSVAEADRIISIDVSNVNDFKEFKSYTLHVEVMGKYSNAFLTSDNILLGALKNASQNYEKGRILLSGAKYLFPLKQDKISPYDKEQSIATLSGLSYPPTASFILNNFLGFAPVTAEEIAFLIEKKCEKQGYSPILAYEAIEEFLQTPISPLIINSNEYSDVLPFDYLHLNGNRTSFSSFLEAEERFYTDLEAKQKLEGYKATLLSKLASFKRKEEKKLALLNERIKEASSAEKYRLYGELITANIYRINKGETSVELLNYYSETGETVKILLDKDLTPQKNAERYFKRYTKLKKALEISLEQLKATQSELNYAKRIEFSIISEDGVSGLEEIEGELKLQGLIKSQEVKAKASKKVSAALNALNYLVDGFTVKVGKNNLQNEALLNEASRTDLWLHVKDYHSSFVIIKAENKAVPDSVILTAAEICAFRSEAKGGGKISVDYCLRKFVKKPPASRPGSVIYTDYKTVVVTPNGHEDKLN